MSAPHTKGPWNLGAVTVIDTATGKLVLDDETGFVTIGDDDEGTAACEVHVEGENAAANARLIAAAPDLLEAAVALQRRLDQHFFGGPDRSQDWKEQAAMRAAIAKAEGRT